MDFRTQIETDMSKANIEYIRAIVGDDQQLFAELWDLSWQGIPKISFRAMWAIEKCIEKKPYLIEPWLHELFERLPNIEHVGIRRMVLKIFSEIDIPEDFMGTIFNLCFDWYQQNNQETGVRIYCMEILFNITMKEPDLKNELIVIFENESIRNTPAVDSRARQLLKKLTRLTRKS